MTVHRYPEGVLATGQPCWCGSQFLAAHVVSTEIDHTVHSRGWCERLRPVPQVA